MIPPVVLAGLAFVVAAGLVFGVTAVLWSRSNGDPIERVARLRGTSAAPTPSSVRRGPREPADQAPILSSLLRGTSLWEELQMEILRAGLLLKPSELVAFGALSLLVGSALGLVLTKQIPLGLLVGMGCGLLPWVVVKLRQAKRRRDLASQLPDAIDILSAALRTGFSLLRGVQTVAGQMQPPISDEFRRLAAEVQMGMGTSEALDNLVDRTQCYDLELVVAAIQIWSEVGGNLSEVLDNIAETVRERLRLQGEINAATAEVRLSAGILFAMPICIALAVNVLNPGYLEPLFTTPVGLTLALTAGLLMSLGALLIRKMLDVDI